MKDYEKPFLLQVYFGLKNKESLQNFLRELQLPQPNHVVEEQYLLSCSVVLCSYWFLETPDEPINDIKVYHPTSGYSTLPDFLSSFKGSGERPVYIGFGSMEELGFFSSIDCVELLAVLNEGNRCFHYQNDYNSTQKHDALSD